jgi:hypothetical protein
MFGIRIAWGGVDQTEKLPDFGVYSSQNVIWMIKARMMKWGEARWNFMRKEKCILF